MSVTGGTQVAVAAALVRENASGCACIGVDTPIVSEGQVHWDAPFAPADGRTMVCPS
jgi:hypothetical protein